MKRKFEVTLTVVLFVILCASISCLYAMDKVELKIGERYVELEYGEEFHDDVTATIFGVDVSNFIHASEEVDTSKIEKYCVYYTCFNKKQARIVNVVDTKAPDIILNGPGSISVEDDISNYHEPGFWAFDNVDGDITEQVKTVVLENGDDEYTYVYSVTDNSGNRAEARRTVTVLRESVVEELPELEINESKVEIEKQAHKKEVYLTFDDGPSELTPSYLDVLENYGVNATFFVVGTEFEGRNSILERTLNEGNVLALHGNSHEYSEIYQNSQTATDNFYIEHEVLQATLGIDTRIVRFPGGASNTVSRKYCEGVMTVATNKIVEAGYSYFDWNVDSNDAGEDIENSQNIYQNVIDGVSSGTTNVVLMHDCGGHEATLEALSKIIETLQMEGYEFKVITPETEPVHHTIFN